MSERSEVNARYPWGPPRWTTVEEYRARLVDAERAYMDARLTVRKAETDMAGAEERLRDCQMCLLASERAWNEYMASEHGQSDEAVA